MVKYCVANECPIDEYACTYCCRNGHLECLKCLREEAKAPWDSDTAYWAAANGHLHILEYLVERKYDQYRQIGVLVCGQVRPLGLFEVLARNRQSALGRLEPYEYAHRKTTPSVYNTSSTTTVHYSEDWSYEGGVLHTTDSDDDYYDVTDEDDDSYTHTW